MLRRVLALLGLLLIAGAAPAAAQAEKRVALVIGNAAYAHLPPMKDADQDAVALASALERFGFSVVPAINADLAAMRAALAKFQRDAAKADAALVFYAGHALRYRGGGYLAPVDATLKDETSIEWDTLKLQQALDALPQARAAFLILDGCGQQQLAPLLSRFGADALSGLGAPPEKAGVFTAQSESGDDPACEISARSSLMPRALLSEIDQPGLESGQLFERVRQLMGRRSSGRQNIAFAGAAPRGFSFAKADFADAAFRRLGFDPALADLRAFVGRYGDHPLAEPARAMIAAKERRPKAQAGQDEWRGLLDDQWRQERQAKARATRYAALEGRWSREDGDRRAEQAAIEARRQAQERAERERIEREERARQAELAAQERRRQEQERAERERTERETRARIQREQEEERKRQAELAAQERRRQEQERVEREKAEREARARAQEEERKRQAEAEQRRQAELAAEQRRRQDQERAEREEKARQLREQEEQRRRQAELAVAEQRRQEQERVERERADRDARVRQLREQEEQRRRQQAEQEAAEQRLAAQAQAQAAAPRPVQDAPVAGQAVDEANRFTLEQRRLAQERIERERRARGQPDEFAAPLASESGAPTPAVGPLASLAPAQQDRAPAPPIVVPKAGTPEFLKSAQEELKRLGCYSGIVHGRMNNGTKAALESASKKIGASFQPDPLSEDGLRLLKTQPEGLCGPVACPAGQVRRGDICVASRPSRAAEPEAPRARPRPAQQRQVTRPAASTSSSSAPSRGGCFTFNGRQYCQ